MSRPQNIFESYSDTQNGIFWSQKIKTTLELGYKQKLWLKEAKKIKVFSDVWVDQKTVLETYSSPKNILVGLKETKMTTKFSQVKSQSWRKHRK